MGVDEFVTNYNDTIRENAPLPEYLVKDHMKEVAMMFSEYCGYIPNFDVNCYGQIILIGTHETQEN